MAEQVRITYVRSAIGRNYKQKRTVRALGFSRLHQSRVVEWNPSIRGMVNKIIHLLKVEPVEAGSVVEESREVVKETREETPKAKKGMKDAGAEDAGGEEVAAAEPDSNEVENAENG